MQHMQPRPILPCPLDSPARSFQASFAASDCGVEVYGSVIAILLAECLAVGAYDIFVFGMHGYESRNLRKILDMADSLSTNILPVDEPKNSFTPAILL